MARFYHFNVVFNWTLFQRQWQTRILHWRSWQLKHCTGKTMATGATLPSYPTFDPDEEISSLPQKWEEWSEGLEDLMSACAITDHERKFSVLKFYGGEKLRKLEKQLNYEPERGFHGSFRAVYQRNLRSISIPFDLPGGIRLHRHVHHAPSYAGEPMRFPRWWHWQSDTGPDCFWLPLKENST